MMPLSRRRIAQLTHPDPKRRALAMLEVAPAEWEALAELLRKSGNDPGQAGIMLEGIAVSILRTAVYLQHSGPLPASHARAVKAQNRDARRVRKALGYQTTPDINV